MVFIPTIVFFIPTIVFCIPTIYFHHSAICLYTDKKTFLVTNSSFVAMASSVTFSSCIAYFSFIAMRSARSCCSCCCCGSSCCSCCCGSSCCSQSLACGVVVCNLTHRRVATSQQKVRTRIAALATENVIFSIWLFFPRLHQIQLIIYSLILGDTIVSGPPAS